MPGQGSRSRMPQLRPSTAKERKNALPVLGKKKKGLHREKKPAIFRNVRYFPGFIFTFA